MLLLKALFNIKAPKEIRHDRPTKEEVLLLTIKSNTTFFPTVTGIKFMVFPFKNIPKNLKS